jgi:tRNA (Thr-GGU) A37 N-methylase
MSTELVMQSIGIIRTRFRETRGMPIQPAFSHARGRVEVFPEYADGLQDYVSDFDSHPAARAGWYDSRPAEKEGRS